MIRVAMLALVLAGCSPRVVSVPTPCIEAKDIPAEPAPVRDKLSGNAVADAQTLAIGLLEWKSAAIRSIALLKGCAS